MTEEPLKIGIRTNQPIVRRSKANSGTVLIKRCHAIYLLWTWPTVASSEIWSMF
jgi:hypothetical protein